MDNFKLVTENVTKPDLDDATNEMLNVEMSVDAIPNLDLLLLNMYNLLKEIETPQMKELEKKDRKEFEIVLTHKYYPFIQSTRYINLLLEPERYSNMTIFLNMIERLKKVQDGKKDIKASHSEWCEFLNNKYVYPTFGGKAEFEAKMKKDIQN